MKNYYQINKEKRKIIVLECLDLLDNVYSDGDPHQYEILKKKLLSLL